MIKIVLILIESFIDKKRKKIEIKTYFIYFNLTSIFHKIEIDFTPFYIGKKQEQDAKEQ